MTKFLRCNLVWKELKGRCLQNKNTRGLQGFQMMTKKEILPATGGFLCVDFSADSMGEHRVRDLFKAGDIGARKEITLHAVLLRGIV